MESAARKRCAFDHAFQIGQSAPTAQVKSIDSHPLFDGAVWIALKEAW
jgi:hypothetical protein